MTRNLGNGPGFAQLDLRLTTVFRAPRPPSRDPESAKREQTDNLEMSVDLFNALNRVNASTFVGVVSSPVFGQANAARTARTAQARCATASEVDGGAAAEVNCRSMTEL
jgi:hypothetical protein